MFYFFFIYESRSNQASKQWDLMKNHTKVEEDKWELCTQIDHILSQSRVSKSTKEGRDGTSLEASQAVEWIFSAVSLTRTYKTWQNNTIHSEATGSHNTKINVIVGRCRKKCSGPNMWDVKDSQQNCGKICWIFSILLKTSVEIKLASHLLWTKLPA